MTDMNDTPDGETRSYDDLTVEQLKELLKERDLPVSGNKAELVERLVESDAAIDGPPADDPSANASASAFDAGISTTAPEEAQEAPLPPEAAPYDPTGTEADPSLDDRRMAELARWRAENPDATVIPPSLLPSTFRDGTVSTHGLPEELTAE